MIPVIPDPVFLLLQLLWWLRHLGGPLSGTFVQSCSVRISGTHEVGQLSWLWRQTPHTQGDGNKPPTRALSSPSYYLFSAPVWCGLFSTYCTVVTCWPLFDFCTKKKLCYRNQHTIFLNLERRYYGDWKYGQVSNINYKSLLAVPSVILHSFHICWQYWRFLFCLCKL